MPPLTSESDSTRLRELKDRYRYAHQQWTPIRLQGQKDLRFLTGDPWDEDDKIQRAGRPIIAADQLSQYANQLVNDVRQNKRAIKVSARGSGATDKTAELRANKIREIEYRSHAQLVYTTMFSNTVQRGYGFMAIRRKWASEQKDISAFNQELWLDPIVNPDLITPDPDALMPDGRDMRFCFELEWMDRVAFTQEYPHAQVKDFDAELVNLNKDWFRDAGRKVLVANYWVVETTKRQLLLLKPPPPAEGQPWADPKAVYVDELEALKIPLPKDEEIQDSRLADCKRVKMYTSNGVEILDKDEKPEEWPGQYIPIVACYGKVEYVETGGTSERTLLSLIRLARDVQKGYNYLQSTKFEAIGLTLKTPFIGWRGQATTAQKEAIKASMHTPTAFLEFELNDPVTGLPFPSLPEKPESQLASVIASLEAAAESTRRDLQAAIGDNPSPTEAQRRNDKSGVALKQIEKVAQRGSYHFVDHYEDAIRWGGVILDDLLKPIYDAQRDIAIRKVDGSQEMVTINKKDSADPASPDDYPRFDVGDHDVIISTGPASNDEREVASDFADTLVTLIGTSAFAQIIGPEKAQKILSMAVRLKDVGHIGDQIADLLSPPEAKDGQKPTTEQLQSQIAEMQAKGQQLVQAFQQAQDELKADKAKADADLKKAGITAQTQIVLQRMKDATAIAVAKLTLIGKGILAEHEAEIEAIALASEQAHQSEQAGFERAHAMGMAATGHEQSLEAADQQHQQGLDASDQAHGHVIAQQQNQADLAPPPAAGA